MNFIPLNPISGPRTTAYAAADAADVIIVNFDRVYLIQRLTYRNDAGEAVEGSRLFLADRREDYTIEVRETREQLLDLIAARMYSMRS